MQGVRYVKGHEEPEEIDIRSARAIDPENAVVWIDSDDAER